MVSCDDSQVPSLPDSFRAPIINTELSDTNSVLDDNFLASPEEISYPKIDTAYYETGEIKDIVRYERNLYEYSYINYHKNGELAQIGKQGVVIGCGRAVDTTRYYYLNGRLSQETTYDYWLNEQYEGCHGTRMVLFNTHYGLSGKVKSKTFIETCYDCEECPCGTWEFYDENGLLTKTEEYGDCFDSKLGCLED